MSYLCNNIKLKQRRRDLRRSQTDAEKTIWRVLRAKRFCNLKFYRQYSVGPYILDFYCPKIQLAIELDGSHHNEDNRRKYDEYRSEYLAAHGINVIRFWNHDVLKDIRVVLDKIAFHINL